MTHGSLFSGIGGFDLAAQWMGWKNIFHCEIEEFPRKILNHYWPDAISYGNIKKTDFSIHNGNIDILTGGFPCQPYSQAGKRLGKEDERHLWPEMLRAITEIKPRWIVGENVYGIVNWNGGMVFEEVQAQLEDEGYTVQPYVLPAAAVGAPHRRDRVWFVAYSGLQRPEERQEQPVGFIELCEERNTANSDYKRLQGGKKQRGIETGRQKPHELLAGCFRTEWKEFPTQSPVCSRDDGISTRLDGITFPKWRNESIKAYGNAIVPQVAIQIFKAIEEYDRTRNHSINQK